MILLELIYASDALQRSVTELTVPPLPSSALAGRAIKNPRHPDNIQTSSLDQIGCIHTHPSTSRSLDRSRDEKATVGRASLWSPPWSALPPAHRTEKHSTTLAPPACPSIRIDPSTSQPSSTESAKRKKMY